MAVDGGAYSHGSTGWRRWLRSLGADHLDSDGDRQNLIELALLFAALTAAIYAVGWVAWQTYGLAPGSPEQLVTSVFDRWDVLNYKIISEDGYGNRNFITWFPALPLIMRAGSQIGVDPWVTGTIAVLFCTALLTLVFYALARLDFGEGVAKDSTIFLLVFPSSFFLFVPYTEAILLSLAVMSLYFARSGRWALACLCAGLATGVRTTGIFLAPALVVEYLHQMRWQWRDIRPDAAWLLVTPAGLIAYMAYLWAEFDDPFAYYDAQINFPRLETVETRGGIEFIPSLIDEVRVIFTSPSFSEQVQNTGGLIGLVVFVVLFALMLWFRLRWSYIVFAALAGFTPLLVGRLDSVNRYIITAFPIFFVLGLCVERYPQMKVPLISVCLGFLFLSAARFASYHWAG